MASADAVLDDTSVTPVGNGISQACYIVQIHHSGPELSIYRHVNKVLQSV